MFQDAALFPWLSVEHNVELPLKLRKVPKAERRARVAELLDMVQLTAFARRQPHELSGGMRQRAALARALARDAEVLLMDEPFGALDALTRTSAQRFLTEIWERHRRTIAFVTHDIDEAILLADTVCVMSPRPGRVREVVEIDIPRPRSFEVRESARFIELRHRLLALIFEHERSSPAVS
jgi:ABC-type nitrate/sulfonate/bicarbonate transport system ATPase subunit